MFVFNKLTHLLIFTLLHVTSQNTPVIETSMKPEGGKVEVGSYWMIKCDVSDAKNVVWYKWVGDLRTMIGYNDVVLGTAGDVISAGRFKLTGQGGDGNYASSLYLTSARVEDSGRFECVVDHANASVVFVICDDVDSDHCECMLKSAWANPMCFPQQYTDKSSHYKKLLAGLGITLAVTTLYVVLVTLLYGRDCIMLFHKDRMEEVEKKKRMKMGRADISRNRIKKDTVDVFEQQSDSEQAHLASSNNSEMSAETVGDSEDSGFSGSTQKDKKKVSYRVNSEKSYDNNYETKNTENIPKLKNTNTKQNTSSISNKIQRDSQQANHNLAYQNDVGEALYDRNKWNVPSDQSAIKSVSSYVKTPQSQKDEFSGTMI